MILPKKIISGGQTGADRAGLDFAIERDIPHGGWCPRGRRSEEREPIPAIYNLKETAHWGYAERTERNVADSDATLIFNLRPGRSLSPGCALTMRTCAALRKPYLLVRPTFGPDAAKRCADDVAQFLCEYRPSVLNVAGNREESVPGIAAFVRNVLAQAWELTPRLAASAEVSLQQRRDKPIQLGFRL